MSTGVSDRMAALATLSPAQLRAAWLQAYKRPAPPFTPELLRRGLAYRMQEKMHGKLEAAHVRELERVAAARSGAATLPAPSRLVSGTQLVRDWGGSSHHVLVLEDGGFSYGDKRYRSLSVIARAITGVRWSGPRFFGLRSNRSAGDA